MLEKERPRYLKANDSKKEEKVRIDKVRLGNKARASRFWMEEEEKKCSICGKEFETLKHVLEDCEVTGDKTERWEEILGSKVRKELGKLHENSMEKRVEREDRR